MEILIHGSRLEVLLDGRKTRLISEDTQNLRYGVSSSNDSKTNSLQHFKWNLVWTELLVVVVRDDWGLPVAYEVVRFFIGLILLRNSEFGYGSMVPGGHSG